MPVFLFIFFLMLVAYAWLIEFYRKSWNAIPEYKCSHEPSVFLSVVVAVRNEEDNIINLLNSLQQQSYSHENFEIIIVDDQSGDRTWELLTTYLSGSGADVDLSIQPDAARINLVPLRAVALTDGSSNKKNAITTGIAAAKGELIVTTDADCRFHVDWLLTIAGFYEEKKPGFIAAPVMIEGDRSLLSVFQSADFLTLQGITGAAVHRRFHSMCNGANLAYEKKAFDDVKGFEGIDHIPSGDDMLLMHKIYQQDPNRVCYLKAAEAIVVTGASKTWKSFFQQRIRWASKSVHYDDRRIFYVLLLVYLINIGFLVLGISSFWNNIYFFFFVILLLAKIIIEFPFVNSVALFFGQSKLMKYFPFLQPIHILYTIIAGWLGRFGSYEWKGRKVKT